MSMQVPAGALRVASRVTGRPRTGSPRHRLLLLLAGGIALVLGIYTGLARAGVEHRFVGANLHAVLMVLGFLGTLVALERAVALGRAWGYLAPTASAAAVVVLPFSATAGGLLLVLAGVVVTLTYVALLRRQVDLHLAIMALGALAWVAAAALWTMGTGPLRITPLLAGFLVLTIVGERLELSRLTLPGRASRRRFLVAVALFILGVALTPTWRATGLIMAGLALLGQVGWLARHDLARRTIRRPGLPRFAAACMLLGYGWLGISGVLWIAMGAGVTGLLLHDALVHSLFLGFVLSMVMGHAPIIVPAVLGARLQFRRLAYLPLVVLHVSVAGRIVADLTGSLAWREVFLHGNVTALLLFVGVTVSTLRRGERMEARRRSTVAGTKRESLGGQREFLAGRASGRTAEMAPRGRAGSLRDPDGVDPFRGVRRLAVATAAGTLLLIAMGGSVRATNSGLACPDWPACYGKWIPPADVNIWFEHSHRLWAGVILLAITWLTGWTVLRFRHRPALWGLSLAALVLVLVQAGLGAAVVLLKLRAGLVTAHLGMSLVVVACLIVLAVIARPGTVSGRAGGAYRVGRWAAGLGGLVFLQALLGGQATGRGAAFVFNAVPIWLTDDTWTGHAREWLHVTHRAGGYLVATAVVVLAIAVRRARRTDPTVPSWAETLAWVAVGLVAVQVGLGIANVLTRASVVSAVGHLAVASWLWSTVVLLAARGLASPVARAAPNANLPVLTHADGEPATTDPSGPGDHPSSTTQKVHA